MTYKELLKLASLIVDFQELYPDYTNESEDLRAAVVNEAVRLKDTE